MAGERIVIANTTPLINFAEIGRIELLRELFGEVIVRGSVLAELQVKRALFPAAAAAAQAPFLRARQATNPMPTAAMSRELHEGKLTASLWPSRRPRHFCSLTNWLRGKLLSTSA